MARVPSDGVQDALTVQDILEPAIACASRASDRKSRPGQTRLPTFLAAPITFSLALLILCIFEITWLMGGDDGIRALGNAARLSLDEILSGRWWTVVMSALVNGSWDHVLANVACVLALGLLLEPALGSAAFLRACLFALVTSSITTLLVGSSGIGTSGIVEGLVGVLLTRPIRSRPDGTQTLDCAWLVAVAYVATEFSMEQGDGQVGLAAHLGGLIGGLVCGGLWPNGRRLVGGRTPPRRRLALSTLAALGVFIAFAPNARWSLAWHSRLATIAEHKGDLIAASHHWDAVERIADPRCPLEAEAFESAARFRWSNKEGLRARAMMAEVAQTSDDARVFAELGLFEAVAEPRDEGDALVAWFHGLELDACQPDVLYEISWTLLAPHDTTLYWPKAARSLAWCAVEQDEMKSPEYLRTLACAQLLCGDTERASYWIHRALALNPEDRELYETNLATIEEQAARERLKHTKQASRTLTTSVVRASASL